MADLDIRVTGADTMAQVGARLRKAAGGGELKKELAASIRAATKPVVTDVQDAARSVRMRTAHGGGKRSAGRRRRGGSTGLRESMAKAVTARNRFSGQNVGVSIEVNSSKLRADQARLPRKIDSGKPWRHPVYGNRNNWVSQTGQPWFAVTIERHLDEVRLAILHAVEATVKKLEDSA